MFDKCKKLLSGKVFVFKDRYFKAMLCEFLADFYNFFFCQMTREGMHNAWDLMEVLTA